MHRSDGDESNWRRITGTGDGMVGVQLKSPTHSKGASGLRPSRPPVPMAKTDVLGLVVRTICAKDDRRTGFKRGRVNERDRGNMFCTTQPQGMFNAVAKVIDA